MAEENTIILKGMEDWIDWIKTIKVIADGLEIWEYMDPEVEPADVPRLTRPAKPTGEGVDSGDLEIFKYDLKSWSEKKSALKKIPEKIIQTIDKSCFNFIEDHSTPYTMLRDLREKLKPNDNLYKNILLKKWKSLQRYPTRQDLENWINEYETCYQKLTKINYFSGSTSNAVEEFIDILPHTEFRSWAGQQIEGGEDLDMRTILQKFRESVVRAKAKSESKGKMAFASPKFQGTSTDGKEEEAKKKEPRSISNDKCEACGYKGHVLEGCFIIFPEKRPSYWRSNPEKEKKILEKIKDNPSLANKVKDLRKTEKNGQPSAHAVIKPTTLTDKAAYSTSEYELRDSVLLDSAASDHVTNDSKRLTSYRPVEEEFVWSGNTKVPILGYGTMKAYGTHPITLLQVELELENTVYIPTFHTSLISMKKLRKQGYKWDQDIDCLVNSKGIVCEVFDMFDLYPIEYNKPKPAAFKAKKKSAQKPVLEGTIETFHVRFGHVNPEIIKHLPDAVEGIKLIESAEKTECHFLKACSVCAGARLQKIVSRRPFPPVSRPYERVHVDLIVMNTAFNGAKYALHSCDQFSKYHDFFPQQSKTEVRTNLDRLDAKVKRQYGVTISIIHIDGEGNIQSKEAIIWAKDKGYKVETTAADSPEQNGLSERSGGIINQRARALAIQAKLPKNLWPEIYRAAVYLINITPTKSLKWKTPHEVLRKATGSADIIPRASHIKVYGCASYFRDVHVAKGDKLQSRCLIGYLVGYEASTVYRVWNPRTNRVVRTRDVWFDETIFFNPDDPYNLENPETVKSMKTTLKLPELNDLLDSIDIESDNEEDDTIESQEPEIEPTTEKQKQGESDSLPIGIPTPESTPEPTYLPDVERDETSTAKELDESTYRNRAPRAAEISADIDKRLIISGSRRRREAHHSAIQNPSQFIGFRSAFALGSERPVKKIHRDDMPLSPTNWKEFNNHEFREQYLQAREVEWTELLKRQTFKEVPIPSGVKPMPVKWVDLEKYDKDGYLTKFKSRLVARGDLQVPTMQDNYAATLAARTFRFMMALVAVYDLDAEQLDAVNAFVNSPIDDLIYLELPNGYRKKGRCLRLLRALYGLKQSPRLWAKELRQFLESKNFKQLGDEPCAYSNGRIVIIFFVDDFILLSGKEHREERDEFKKALMAKYPMRELGPLKWFLGIRVIRDRESRRLWLCQDTYIKKIVTRYNLEGYKPTSIPLPPEKLEKYDKQAEKSQIHQFQQKVGSIMYAAVMTRPDIACATSKLCEHLQNPGPHHIDAVNHTIRFLAGTATSAIEYSRDYIREVELAVQDEGDVFVVASDAAFADNSDRKSTQGYIMKLFGGAIDWKSGKQSTVTTSTTEAELLALSRTAQETYWWRRLFDDVQFDPGHEIHILCDNRQTVDSMLKESIELKTKLRHVDIYNHWLRQEAQEGRIAIKWVSTREMPADGLTKLLPRQEHEAFRNMINLVDIADHIEKE
jgi:hypothetical protein